MKKIDFTKELETVDSKLKVTFISNRGSSLNMCLVTGEDTDFIIYVDDFGKSKNYNIQNKRIIISPDKMRNNDKFLFVDRKEGGYYNNKTIYTCIVLHSELKVHAGRYEKSYFDDRVFTDDGAIQSFIFDINDKVELVKNEE